MSLSEYMFGRKIHVSIQHLCIEKIDDLKTWLLEHVPFAIVLIYRYVGALNALNNQTGSECFTNV